MLKTFEKFIYIENFLNSILENDSWDLEKITEEFRYEYYHRKNKPSIKIDNHYRNKLIEIETKIEEYIKTKINPNFFGEYTNENGDKKTVIFEIQSSEHWYEKFFRKEIEDPENKTKIQNPGLYEGINILYNNRDILAKYMINGTLKSGMSVTVKSSDYSLYNEIIIIEKIIPNIGYRLKMNSQIKGVDFNVKTDKTIKLHPNGPKKINP